PHPDLTYIKKRLQELTDAHEEASNKIDLKIYEMKRAVEQSLDIYKDNILVSIKKTIEESDLEVVIPSNDSLKTMMQLIYDRNDSIDDKIDKGFSEMDKWFIKVIEDIKGLSDGTVYVATRLDKTMNREFDKINNLQRLLFTSMVGNLGILSEKASELDDTELSKLRIEQWKETEEEMKNSL
ncbi:hypothetical protein JRB68_004402, partial [Salmonella enterica]|nr:hypothetical protein [Salmonella enterica]